MHELSAMVSQLAAGSQAGPVPVFTPSDGAVEAPTNTCDVCSCNIACPCEFAQAPTDNKCQGVLAYRINEGTFGDTDMAGLNVVGIIRFEGDLWAGETKCTVGLLVDDRANEAQLQAIQAIWGGAGGGWPRAAGCAGEPCPRGRAIGAGARRGPPTVAVAWAGSGRLPRLAGGADQRDQALRFRQRTGECELRRRRT